MLNELKKYLSKEGVLSCAQDMQKVTHKNQTVSINDALTIMLHKELPLLVIQLFAFLFGMAVLYALPFLRQIPELSETLINSPYISLLTYVATACTVLVTLGIVYRLKLITYVRSQNVVIEKTLIDHR
ncbi:hypothetical protein OH460_07935 [Vibrio sp. Makdt]|uniref:hypothetical protein n=1 Tax=Vibrio sp. Makdt TaxID=2998828 RepID=UPI0022CD435D|nr:hypothetical protein [Vibrio sp. Makdt]MDA0152227.1 hypothetical protein [Vibrio sp. Makdt]